MKFDLAAMWARQRPRRRTTVLRETTVPAMLASDLYAAAYLPIVKLWSDALSPVAAQYEGTIAAMTTDSASEIGDVIANVDKQAGRITLSVPVVLRHWAKRVEEAQRRRWIAAIGRASSPRSSMASSVSVADFSSRSA